MLNLDIFSNVKYFYTSDQHYYHYNIIKYCKRPFINIDEMNSQLIKNHNDVVGVNDITFFGGDVTLAGNKYVEQIKELLSLLNGRKILILGNHDQFKPFTYVDIGFESVHTSYIFKNVNIVHNPNAVKDNYMINLVAHVHGLFNIRHNCINVGVDVWGYKPVMIDDIFKRFIDYYKLILDDILYFINSIGIYCKSYNFDCVNDKYVINYIIDDYNNINVHDYMDDFYRICGDNTFLLYYINI